MKDGGASCLTCGSRITEKKTLQETPGGSYTHELK